MSARDDKLAAALVEWFRDPHIPSFRVILARHGLAVLPVEPTRAMVDAAIDRYAMLDGETIYHGVYRAMLAAASEDRTDDR